MQMQYDHTEVRDEVRACGNELFQDVGPDVQPASSVALGPDTTTEVMEARLLEKFSGELPHSFISCYAKHGAWFDALKVALDAVDDGELPSALAAEIPPPILHCVLARRRVLGIAETHGITSSSFKPFSSEPLPVLPPLDFSTPQLKAQRTASEIVKRAEFLSLRSSAVAAGANEVAARLDDCASFGAGSFLNAIPLGRDRSGRFVMRGDHWRIATRCHLGLPPLGISPGDLCLLCGKRWDYGHSGCLFARAAIHPSVCSKGQLRNRRHDAVVDVLCEAYRALGGTAAADHWRQLNAAGSGTLGSVCALESGNRVDLILYGAGKHGADVAVDVSFVCAEVYVGVGFAAAIKAREDAKNALYFEECKQANLEFHPFVLGAHGGFGKTAKALWGLLRRHADSVQGRDWRHSWTAMSFSSVWLQKLSIAIANQTAIELGSQRRATVCSRQRALGHLGLGNKNGKSGGLMYNSVVDRGGLARGLRDEWCGFGAGWYSFFYCLSL